MSASRTSRCSSATFSTGSAAGTDFRQAPAAVRPKPSSINRPWRGNIRELENAVEIAVIRSQDRTELTEQDFPPSRESVGHTGDWPPPVPVTAPGTSSISKRWSRGTRRDLILRTLELTQGNKNKAAQILRLKRTTLIEKLKRFET